VLEETHREYLDIGQRHGLPIVALSSTWRASRERVARSPYRSLPVNADNIRSLRELRDTYGREASPILNGGQIGPRGDAYRPDDAPRRASARAFAEWQVGGLADGSPDFLIAMTLPAVGEAAGIADALAETGLPYLLSFVIRGDGTVLDGTPLDDAFKLIDESTARTSLGYGINCVHPTTLSRALRNSPSVAARLLLFRANASALRPEELDGSADLVVDEPEPLAAGILGINRHFGIPILGGCCGTGTEHIAALASMARLATRQH
jgi:homocysteine S-methyltransferase